MAWGPKFWRSRTFGGIALIGSIRLCISIMNHPLNSIALDILAARITITDYGDFLIVDIPGVTEPSEAECTAVFKQAGQQQTTVAFHDSLVSRLQCTTPPLDEDEELEISRQIEAYARKDLKADSCPPCYSLHLDIPFQNLPKENAPIISY